VPAIIDINTEEAVRPDTPGSDVISIHDGDSDVEQVVGYFIFM